MAERQRRIVVRGPLTVLAVAGVAAVSMGDLVIAWYNIYGRGSSAPGEYPIRIVLPQTGPEAEEDRSPARPEPTAVAVEIDDSEASAAADQLADLTGQLPADTIFGETGGAAHPSADGLLAIHFDLADPDRPTVDGSAIEIRKAIRLNGADAGDARIHVDANSQLSIAREELGRLLARLGRQELMGQLDPARRFVSFDEMRRQGIEVRYDPVSDRVLVSI